MYVHALTGDYGSVTQMLTNVTVLDLSRNDLGAGSFHGLIGSMYRAQSLPLEYDPTTNTAILFPLVYSLSRNACNCLSLTC